jgi:hypothetical protein
MPVWRGQRPRLPRASGQTSLLQSLHWNGSVRCVTKYADGDGRLDELGPLHYLFA